MQTEPLIEAAELAARLEDPRCVVIDCRFDLMRVEAGRDAYLRAHIPGARYAGLEQDLATRPGPAEGRHPLPDPPVFAARLGAWGVSNGSRVVAYDEASGAFAARLWWMLRWLGHEQVAVLNGGFSAWRAQGLPLQQAPPVWEPARFAAGRVHEEWVVGSEHIPLLQRGGALVLDARSAERYRGERERIDPVAGHVPGAVSRPFSDSLLPDGRFKPQSELKQQLERLAQGRAGQQLIAMCGSGVTACHLLLAMRAAGLDDGRLFAGSWSEWIRDPQRPVATGEQS